MIRTAALLLGLAASGCVAANTVVCDDGRTCPSGTSCRELTDPAASICATSEQLEACRGKAELDPCMVKDVQLARCYDGVCLAAGCGNGRVDPDEVCDDGNRTSGDHCAGDCASVETCGNGVLDILAGEACDDGNLLDRDGCSSMCGLEEVQWVEHTRRPPARMEAMSAYDARRDRVVIFGGISDSFGSPVIGTMEWDGAGWVRFRGVDPPRRIDGAMAFDGARIMMYGGNTSETWLFDGASWAPAARGPGRRAAHAMAFDSRRKRVVVFGGDVYAEKPGDFMGLAADTWEWNGSTWSQASPAHSPPARAYALMAYDSVHGVLVLAGGTNGGSTDLADTWTYDGTDWKDVTPTSGPVPLTRNASIAFDVTSGQLVAFGGCDPADCGSSATTGPTRAWTGAAWVDLAPSNPPLRRSFASLVGTPSGLLMFGGRDDGPSTQGEAYGDTWKFAGGEWTQPAAPSARSGAVVVHDAAHGELLLWGGIDSTGSAQTDTWGLSMRGWTQHTGGVVPSSGGSAAYDPNTRSVVMYGGAGATWVWNGAWASHPSPTYPSWAGAMPMAFDGAHVTMIGIPAGGPIPPALAETWSWTGSAWSKATPPTSPPVRVSPSVAFDPIRRELVMFGGFYMGGQLLDDTWTYDGTTWTKHDVAFHPPPGSSSPLVWNPAQERLVLLASATWEWDGMAWSLHGFSDDAPTVTGSVVTSFLGDGLMLYGSHVDTSARPTTDEIWTLRWEGSGPHELCGTADSDGDMLAGCADPDCWPLCTPLCPPGTSCAATEPHCGNASCDAPLESCQSCPNDCACTPVCGDFVCETGEAGCPGDCP